MTTLLAHLDSLGPAIADNEVRPCYRYTPRFAITAREGNVLLPFRVRLHGQASPQQLVIFEIAVNEQTGAVSTEVKFGFPGQTGVTKAESTPQALASDMTCFPAVYIQKVDADKKPIPESVWRMTPVWHPTFHEWIVSTFGAQPGFVQSDHYTPRDFIDYMRYMALFGPASYGPVQW